MFQWISLRKSKPRSTLALVICSFLIGLTCMYLYYNLVGEKHVSLNLTLVGKGLKGFAQSFYIKSKVTDAVPPPKPNPLAGRPIDSSLAMSLIKGIEYFDTFFKQRYLYCKATISRDTNVAYGKCRNFSNMHFIDGSRVVAMPSFPGSGSTWARTALEQATGIYTGSVYCDKKLKSKGFAGEWVVSANVLTVKTHLPNRKLFPRAKYFHDPNKYKDITAVILLVRNPLDSIISYWNFLRSSENHTATTSPKKFGMYQ